MTYVVIWLIIKVSTVCALTVQVLISVVWFVAVFPCCRWFYIKCTSCSSNKRQCWQLYRSRSTRRPAAVLPPFSCNQQFHQRSSCIAACTAESGVRIACPGSVSHDVYWCILAVVVIECIVHACNAIFVMFADGCSIVCLFVLWFDYSRSYEQISIKSYVKDWRASGWPAVQIFQNVNTGFRNLDLGVLDEVFGWLVPLQVAALLSLEVWDIQSLLLCRVSATSYCLILLTAKHWYLGILVICEHAIAYAIAYFAKIRIAHILPHIMAFSKFRIFIYAFRIFIYA